MRVVVGEILPLALVVAIRQSTSFPSSSCSLPRDPWSMRCASSSGSSPVWPACSLPSLPLQRRSICSRFWACDVGGRTEARPGCVSRGGSGPKVPAADPERVRGGYAEVDGRNCRI